ncbi:hypothetical protein HY612_04555 [Candidatus Roizmanbacteria bacterium]|nr:hypothetical protein [Candidatus Roizmanbacteria bacterium]
MIKAILEDSFEKLAEQGATQSKKAVKSAVKQVKQTFSPTKMWEQILGVDSNSPNPSRPSTSPESLSPSKSHSPLDFEKLGKKYQDAEAQKTESLRQRLFQLVKQGEEKILYEKKKEEAEKKQKELYEAQEKQRKEEERKKQQAAELPKGKVKRSIFSHKKVAERQHAELKPSTGKQ